MVLSCSGAEAQLRQDVEQMHKEVNSVIWTGAACADLVDDGVVHWPIKVRGGNYSLGLQGQNMAGCDQGGTTTVAV